MRQSWRLFDNADMSGAGFEFGETDSGFFHMDLPRVSEADRLVEDADVVGSDAVRFGRDLLRGMEVEFTLGVADDPYAGVLGKRGEFLGVWRADKVRRTPGAFCVLQAPTGRVAYGRPRRATPIEDKFLKVGGSRIVATFETMTPNWYGELKSHTVGHSGSVSGGLVAPLTAPLTTVGESVSRSMVTVGGDHASGLTVVFQGPVTDPYVEIGDVRVRLKGSLAWDERVVVDGQPWARHVWRNWTTTDRHVPAQGLLTADSTPLKSLELDPGEYDVFFGGRSLDGSATVSVFWRDAFAAY